MTLFGHRKHSFNPHHGFLRWWTSPWLLQLCVYHTLTLFPSTTKSAIHCLAHPTSLYTPVFQRSHECVPQSGHYGVSMYALALHRRVAVCIFAGKSRCPTKSQTRIISPVSNCDTILSYIPLHYVPQGFELTLRIRWRCFSPGMGANTVRVHILHFTRDTDLLQARDCPTRGPAKW